MKAAVLRDKCRIAVEEVDKPCVKRHDEVLIKIYSAGLCGADLNVFVGNIKFPYPLIPGYSFSGVIEEIGAGVADFQVRDRVCGLNFGSFGAFAEYIVASQDRIYKIPNKLSLEEAVFIEPVALAFKSLELTKPVRGENVLILGQGLLGLIHTQLFKAAKANVIAIDLVPSRLNLSRKFGADYVLNPMKCNVLKEISNISGRGIDIVIEAAGNPEIVELLSHLAGEGVRMVLFSSWNPAIKQFKAPRKETEIYKIFGAERRDCTTALKMISEEKVDLRFLIDKPVSLNRIEEAYSLALNPTQGKYAPRAIAVIINPRE